MPTAMPDVCSVKSGGTVVVPFALPNTLSVAGKDVHGGVALLCSLSVSPRQHTYVRNADCSE